MTGINETNQVNLKGYKPAKTAKLNSKKTNEMPSKSNTNNPHTASLEGRFRTSTDTKLLELKAEEFGLFHPDLTSFISSNTPFMETLISEMEALTNTLNKNGHKWTDMLNGRLINLPVLHYLKLQGEDLRTSILFSFFIQNGFGLETPPANTRFPVITTPPASMNDDQLIAALALFNISTSSPFPNDYRNTAEKLINELYLRYIPTDKAPIKLSDMAIDYPNTESLLKDYWSKIYRGPTTEEITVADLINMTDDQLIIELAKINIPATAPLGEFRETALQILERVISKNLAPESNDPLFTSLETMQSSAPLVLTEMKLIKENMATLFVPLLSASDPQNLLKETINSYSEAETFISQHPAALISRNFSPVENKLVYELQNLYSQYMHAFSQNSDSDYLTALDNGTAKEYLENLGVITKNQALELINTELNTISKLEVATLSPKFLATVLEYKVQYYIKKGFEELQNAYLLPDNTNPQFDAINAANNTIQKGVDLATFGLALENKAFPANFNPFVVIREDSEGSPLSNFEKAVKNIQNNGDIFFLNVDPAYVNVATLQYHKLEGLYLQRNNKDLKAMLESGTQLSKGQLNKLENNAETFTGIATTESTNSLFIEEEEIIGVLWDEYNDQENENKFLTNTKVQNFISSGLIKNPETLNNQNRYLNVIAIIEAFEQTQNTYSAVFKAKIASIKMYTYNKLAEKYRTEGNELKAAEYSNWTFGIAQTIINHANGIIQVNEKIKDSDRYLLGMDLLKSKREDLEVEARGGNPVTNNSFQDAILLSFWSCYNNLPDDYEPTSYGELSNLVDSLSSTVNASHELFQAEINNGGFKANMSIFFVHYFHKLGQMEKELGNDTAAQEYFNYALNLISLIKSVYSQQQINKNLAAQNLPVNNIVIPTVSLPDVASFIIEQPILNTEALAVDDNGVHPVDDLSFIKAWILYNAGRNEELRTYLESDAINGSVSGAQGAQYREIKTRYAMFYADLYTLEGYHLNKEGKTAQAKKYYDKAIILYQLLLYPNSSSINHPVVVPEEFEFLRTEPMLMSPIDLGTDLNGDLYIENVVTSYAWALYNSGDLSQLETFLEDQLSDVGITLPRASTKFKNELTTILYNLYGTLGQNQMGKNNKNLALTYFDQAQIYLNLLLRKDVTGIRGTTFNFLGQNNIVDLDSMPQNADGSFPKEEAIIAEAWIVYNKASTKSLPRNIYLAGQINLIKNKIEDIENSNDMASFSPIAKGKMAVLKANYYRTLAGVNKRIFQNGNVTVVKYNYEKSVDLMKLILFDDYEPIRLEDDDQYFYIEGERLSRDKLMAFGASGKSAFEEIILSLLDMYEPDEFNRASDRNDFILNGLKTIDSKNDLATTSQAFKNELLKKVGSYKATVEQLLETNDDTDITEYPFLVF